MAEQKNIYAGFWLRFAAWIIDQLVLLFSIGIIFYIVDIEQLIIPFVIFVADIFAIVISWLYFAVMESSSKQATLGKMAVGIKVTDVNKKQISFGRATGRYFAKILSGLTLGIGFIMIAFTAKKQGLHDIVAGCLVIKK